ncbi:PAS domain S-box protein [Arenibacter certesii]|uniref:histidine kinase n=1 Tax=Arenibacter certesii TaxID=228955 RepID=A0A918IQ49_9FLAO|nr:PAS domain S-box protein [Arenibacter certesii]GGW26303.1 hypothetical protein GCM10007383_09200 [Arenibacter certesii]
MTKPLKGDELTFLNGGGEMGDLIKSIEWDKTSLGDIKEWPTSLCSTLGLILHSAFPMCYFWGEEHICFYNDAFRIHLEGEEKNPVIGKRGFEAWPEMWNRLGPMVKEVVSTTKPVSYYNENLPFLTNKASKNRYWTFCCSAAFNDEGKVNGALITFTETTDNVKAKTELQESENLLRSMIRQAPVAIAIFRGSEHITEIANSKALELWGRTADEVEDKPILEVLQELKTQGIKEIVDQVFKTGEIFTASEYQLQLLRNQQLETIYLNFSFEPLVNAKGEIDGIMALGVEVTDHVIIRKTIEESEAKYKSLVHGLPVALYICDSEGYIQLFNEAAVKLWGHTPAIGKDLWSGSWKIFTLEGNPVLSEDLPMSHALKGGEVTNPILVVERPNGSRRHFIPHPKPIYNNDGQISGVINTLIDITDQIRGQEKIKESAIRMRAIADNIPNMAWMTHANGSVYWYNKKWQDYTGTTLEEVEGWNWQKVIHPEYLQEVLAKWQQSLKARKEFEMIFPLKGADNGYRQFLTRVLPVYDESGEISNWFGSNTDITEHIEAKKRLEESEQKFRLLADSMPEFVWIADPQGNINYFNQSVFKFSGFTPQELIRKDGWLQMVHPDDREENVRLWKKSIASGEDFIIEHRFYRHDGEYRWQLSRARPQFNENGEITMWVGTSTDIQEQKMFTNELEKQVRERTTELLKLNESLKESEQRYHLMVEEVQDYAILYLNKDGIVENWNAGAEKIKGYTAEEFVGKSFSNFYTEEDQKSGLPQKLLKKAIKNGQAIQEGWRVRKDKTLFWASVVITAVHGNNNKLIGFSKVTRDQTAKKEADDALQEKKIELEQKNNELQKMNKELQSFAYISSHDLQEPLRKIQTFASRIAEKESNSLSEYGLDLFNRMQSSAERMQSLIEDLLAYSRTHNLEGDFKKVALRGIIERVEDDLGEELLDKNATIDIQTSGEVNIIPFQIQQLFHNLFTNSLKFAKTEEPLRITISTAIVKGNTIENENLMDDHSYCRISVTDNGIGFDQRYSDKIFELFQRLHGKNEYPGTGIGLAIIKRIVENHNGAIVAKGELGVGATFHIFLPVEDQKIGI